MFNFPQHHYNRYLISLLYDYEPNNYSLNKLCTIKTLTDKLKAFLLFEFSTQVL
jgi:hypothetical protein